MTSRDLEGKVAIVTGGTSGIGRAVAIGLAQAGASVAIVGRNSQRGNSACADATAGGGVASFIAADVSDPAQCARMVADTVNLYGGVDILVNSAGTFPVGSALEVSPADFDDAFTTNVKGMFFSTQAAAAQMIEQGRGGRVINLASVGGVVGFAGASLYVGTKGAILSLTKSLALEFAPNGILVNAIAPGNVETPMNEHLMADPDYLSMMLSRTPVGRNGRVEDIVPTVLLLAGSGGAFYCGSTLLVDGGWAAG